MCGCFFISWHRPNIMKPIKSLIITLLMCFIFLLFTVKCNFVRIACIRSLYRFVIQSYNTDTFRNNELREMNSMYHYQLGLNYVIINYWLPELFSRHQIALNFLHLALYKLLLLLKCHVGYIGDCCPLLPDQHKI